MEAREDKANRQIAKTKHAIRELRAVGKRATEGWQVVAFVRVCLKV